jgi:hypothetical protein
MGSCRGPGDPLRRGHVTILDHGPAAAACSVDFETEFDQLLGDTAMVLNRQEA